MGDILDLYKTLSELFPANRIFVIDTVILIAFILISIKCPTLRHPRVVIRSAVFVILMTLFTNLYMDGWVDYQDKGKVFILFILISLYTYIAYKSVKGPILFAKRVLNELEKDLSLGRAWERDDLFHKRPFFLIDFVERYRYDLLKAKYYIDRNDFNLLML